MKPSCCCPEKKLNEQELAGRIPKLINQLGSAKLAERENATKELEEIGAPALDALRQAARRDERQRRADELVNKLEQRARPGGRILIPSDPVPGGPQKQIPQ
jgi:hypothetical protein